VSLSSGDEAPHIFTRKSPTARRIFDHQCKKTFATKSAQSGRKEAPVSLSAFGAKRTCPTDRHRWSAALLTHSGSRAPRFTVAPKARRASSQRCGLGGGTPKERGKTMAKTYRDVAIDQMIATVEEAMSRAIDWWGSLPPPMNEAIDKFRVQLGAAIDSVEFVKKALDRRVPEPTEKATEQR
jgi:hypothetical protein